MTDHTPEHEEAPVDEAVSGPPADEGNPASVDPSVDAREEIDPETFPKAYLVKLRDEAAKYRQRPATRDTVAERLRGALVADTGRLTGPSDLAFDDEHLTDPDTLTAALDDLLTRNARERRLIRPRRHATTRWGVYKWDDAERRRSARLSGHDKQWRTI